MKRSAPYTRQKRATRNPQFSDLETEILLDIVEAQQPIGQIGWTAVAESYNHQRQLHSIDVPRDQAALNRKFYAVGFFYPRLF